jgi:hypothetical protein
MDMCLFARDAARDWEKGASMMQRPGPARLQRPPLLAMLGQLSQDQFGLSRHLLCIRHVLLLVL